MNRAPTPSPRVRRPTRRPPARKRRLSGPAKWLRQLWRATSTRAAGDAIGRGVSSDSLTLGASLNALDWNNLRSEVDDETHARVVLAGRTGVGKSALLNALRGDEVSAVGCANGWQEETSAENFGLFTLVDIPDRAPQPAGADAEAWATIESSDACIWIVDASRALQPHEFEWLLRSRSGCRVMLVAANKTDLAIPEGRLDALSRKIGIAVTSVSAKTGAGLADTLLPELLRACPRLATALGREVTRARAHMARQIISQSTLLSSVAGLETGPLVDLPLQILIQLRMVLRIAAMHGEPIGDRYNRELIAALIASVLLRYCAAQLARAIPFVGGLASGALLGAGTWIMGRVMQTYFARGRRWMVRTNRSLSRGAQHGAD